MSILANMAKAANTANFLVDKGAAIADTAVASQSALMASITPAKDVAQQEAAANNASPAAQEAKRSEESAVEQQLCAHLTAIFQTKSSKFGEIMIKIIGTHLTDEQAIKDGVNAAVINALTPKIKEAVDVAMDKMTDLENSDSIYNLLKKKIDEAFDINIRKSVFDNINVLSKDTLSGIVEKLNVQDNAAVKATLTTPVGEPELPVEAPAEPVSATAEAAPIVADVEAVKGGKRRTRKARRKAAKKSGGATKHRRQKILTLA
jgi:hypothetical protein